MAVGSSNAFVFITDAAITERRKKPVHPANIPSWLVCWTGRLDAILCLASPSREGQTSASLFTLPCQYTLPCSDRLGSVARMRAWKSVAVVWLESRNTYKRIMVMDEDMKCGVWIASKMRLEEWMLFLLESVLIMLCRSGLQYEETPPGVTPTSPRFASVSLACQQQL
ncbi:uncharacterized protein LOC123516788 [Portunus trituberculatus]|uniref:uncharacterized protein LOC123516788 n=1 Tax=Portunus trituberculatus TaxID=210409 RepID=UPI001E1CB2AA|nr:uncharacterized protein LOC123516788 [Portunus trituberculatus]XP_045132383.1 uncharacterized protein LOC123516788 [Portunus trituberculatus]XP_045132384.1 uncharacterized protein LOC123516788 [Portunus trituberculatus]XP_045132385.1 uncharacterized protein LOC123516788 [Portunus trituberculatus]XP_045132386.1 uncharacterized protein LOC123516788 [Portunus trituberculatus]XP_045132387.1 uncharacterized protein LOC123516788 [Portunus trituberculatus]